MPRAIVLASCRIRNRDHQEEPLFSRDALLLVGHGSSRKPGAARPLHAHAETIRAMGRFADVAVGMLLGEPSAAAAFQSLSSPVVHVVPFFMEDGYFTRIGIPDLLLPLTGEDRIVRFCRPVGSHDRVADVLQARILRHAEMLGTDPKSVSAVLTGHGSTRDPGRARNLKRHAAKLAATGRFGWVRVAYLEESPLLAETLASGRGHVTAVIGYFANHGGHAKVDLPALIAAERTHRGTVWPPVHDFGTIGDDAGMAELIVDLATRVE